MDTIADHLARAARHLAPISTSPRLDAELLLAQVMGLSRSGLIARGNDPVADDRELSFAALIDQRLHGSPVAYLTGHREFWSLPLHVTPDVLVPRPETELLVELALAILPKQQPHAVLDLGTGSGAVALALASERPLALVTGVDVSPAALEVAADNARALGLSRIEWRLGSWFEPVRGQRFDLIVANPPYIAASDPALATLSREPALALTPGATGLESLAAIAENAALHLRDQGWVILEHGSTQAADVAALLERHGFAHIRSHSDFSGNPRVTLGTVHPQH
jgi:release factor glutamine methyltransferase